LKKKVWAALKYNLFLAIGLLLLYMVFKEVDLKRMWAEMAKAHIFFLALSFFSGFLAMASRAQRWRILIDSLGYKADFKSSFVGVSLGYFANVAFPRLGEVMRCTVLNQTNNIPVNKLFGTVILERVIDLFILLSLICIVFVSRIDVFGNFFIGFFGEKLSPLIQMFQSLGWWLALILPIGLIGLILLVRLVYMRISHWGIIQKVITFFKGIGDGMVTLFRMKKKGSFIFHTAFIWFNYVFMTWICFYAYDPTAFLGMMEGLFMTVIGGLGMSAPVQGGFGTFHFLVEKALMLFDIVPVTDEITGERYSPGLVFATLVHSTQFLLVLILGVISLVLFSFSKRKNKLKNGEV